MYLKHSERPAQSWDVPSVASLEDTAWDQDEVVGLILGAQLTSPIGDSLGGSALLTLLPPRGQMAAPNLSLRCAPPGGTTVGDFGRD